FYGAFRQFLAKSKEKGASGGYRQAITWNISRVRPSLASQQRDSYSHADLNLGYDAGKKVNRWTRLSLHVEARSDGLSQFHPRQGLPINVSCKMP
ncbi:MAG: hypothetical protein M3Q07_16360, partial [Pseudobdellovibrionaceae bacterium]|nr:hypothetical protein [Pseudobdellovibrionaceae bacterium]